MTPVALARAIVARLPLSRDSVILEPAFGDGSFIIAIVERLLSMGACLGDVFGKQLYGVELDGDLYEKCLAVLESKFGKIKTHNLQNADFFRAILPEKFDFIVGNPPFGGTFDPDIEDLLDKKYGRWNGHNLKKETYSFFIAKSLDMLGAGGTLSFISSDTFLTISTMTGLRRRLMDQTLPEVAPLRYFSDETSYDMLLLTAVKNMGSDSVLVNGERLKLKDIAMTGNFSWRASGNYAKYFDGPKLGDFVVCTSGMTIGKNEFFIRGLNEGGTFDEPYDFKYFDDPITLEKELGRARLGKISEDKKRRIKEYEIAGETRRNLKVIPREKTEKMRFPHPDYKLYNKANGDIIFSEPKHVIYWKDGGDAVRTFKKNGNWYLHGVGGGNFFEREGLTWHLIASKIKMKYLPKGYILDSGAPCAFLLGGVPHDEMFVILGWTLTDLANDILKNVINHTRNIQGKDVERLPYPWWISKENKKKAIDFVKKLVDEAMAGRKFDYECEEIKELNRLFAYSAKVYNIDDYRQELTARGGNDLFRMAM